MKLGEFIEGVHILQRYTDMPYPLGAEHDIIYFYATERPVQEPDLSRLYELGWHQPDVPEPDEGAVAHGPYDPEEGWGAFV